MDKNLELYEVLLNKKKQKGLEGKKFLEALFSENVDVVINTIKDRTGKYGRYLAEVIHEGVNINDLLVERGFAVYQEY